MLNNNTGVFPTIHIPYIFKNENINNINYEKHYILPFPVSVSPAHLLGSQPTYIRTMFADISLWYTHILMYLLQCQNISDFHTVGESKSVSAAHSSVIKEKTKCLFCCWQSCQPNTQLHFTLFQVLTQSGLADFPARAESQQTQVALLCLALSSIALPSVAMTFFTFCG